MQKVLLARVTVRPEKEVRRLHWGLGKGTMANYNDASSVPDDIEPQVWVDKDHPHSIWCSYYPPADAMKSS